MNEDEKKLLEVLRVLVKAENVKIANYSSATIRSVLFGQRTNFLILQACINIALDNIELMKSEIIKHKKVDAENNTFGDFLKITEVETKSYKDKMIEKVNNAKQLNTPTQQNEYGVIRKFLKWLW